MVVSPSRMRHLITKLTQRIDNANIGDDAMITNLTFSSKADAISITFSRQLTDDEMFDIKKEIMWLKAFDEVDFVHLDGCSIFTAPFYE